MIHLLIFKVNDDREQDPYIQYVILIHQLKHYINYQLLSLFHYIIIPFHNNYLHYLIPFSLILNLNYPLIHLNNQILNMYLEKLDFYLNPLEATISTLIPIHNYCILSFPLPIYSVPLIFLLQLVEPPIHNDVKQHL